ncbi:phosphatidate phosphatase App1 family protein [Marinicella meishanensis]|uniref:phosphatidate phosphatase App1 family protein n=1 Tax=Marinicella meishanensis TaxID=2873263 RepID=UPI001CBDE544|nr:phosphatase domain-containing protein [Marinicella sp. NBU2979]
MTALPKHAWLAWCLLMLQPVAMAGPVSDLKSDETLVFFHTSAWLDKANNEWHIPIHGWVFEPADSSIRKAGIEQALKASHGLTVTAENTQLFADRINALLADNERGKQVVIRFADRSYALPESAPNGHFHHTIKVKQAHLNAAGIRHQLQFAAVLPDRDARQFSGQAQLISPQGLSIISDIDDTVKISAVTQRRELLQNTFYQPFKAVPGMAAHYRHWLAEDGALHFVSSSPWQLYPFLHEFIAQSGFPTADYHLKSFRFKDSSLLNLWTKSTETKPPQIKAILQRYPQRQFILVGDSGEYDPEIYADIQRQFPEQIKHILIRNVTGERASDERFQTAFKGLKPDQWQLFETAAEITFKRP